MNDPRNTAHQPPESLAWPLVDIARIDRRELLRLARGELIRIESDRFGCEIVTDETGEFEAISISCEVTG